MIARLAGRTHEVWTRFAHRRLRRVRRAVLHEETVVTRVTFRALTAAQVRAYAESGEGTDKAGAYAVQGLGAGLVVAHRGLVHERRRAPGMRGARRARGARARSVTNARRRSSSRPSRSSRGSASWRGRRGSFPPTADGTYYHLLATRIASGQGYTWLWPDGVVTPAAHYPVGYPALIAGGYAMFGATPVVAMIVNALLGAAGAWAAHDLLLRARPREGSRSRAGSRRAAPRARAVHRGVDDRGRDGVAPRDGRRLCGARPSRRAAPRRRSAWLVACGLVLGVATLVRPQSIVLAPVLGWLAASRRRRPRRAMTGAVVATGLALAVCAPWTARNCARMERCALVSVNGGWNLAIGTQTTNGGWQEIAVPEACKEVFAEAGEGRVLRTRGATGDRRRPARLARARTGQAPRHVRLLRRRALVPPRRRTPSASRIARRSRSASLETLVSRLLLVGALVDGALPERPHGGSCARPSPASASSRASSPRARWATSRAPSPCSCSGRASSSALPRIVPIAARRARRDRALHAVFFGAGRYGLVVVPFVTALAFCRESRPRSPD